MVNRIDVVGNHQSVEIFAMMLIRITGSQLHAARVLVGLSREEVAERAGLCRHSIRKWETSSDAVPGAMYTHLMRVVDVLEGQGARFSDGGVHLQRPAPVAGSTVVQSAGAAA
jgi:hypothetical protein